MAVDDKTAHTADAFTTITIECDRFNALGFHPIIYHIKHLEERLYLPGISDEEREKMNLLVSEKSDRLKDLEEELSALRQYNHTRFVHARDESRKNIEQERLLEELEQCREELGNRMLEALERPTSPRSARFRRSSTPCRRRRTSFSRTTRILF